MRTYSNLSLDSRDVVISLGPSNNVGGQSHIEEWDRVCWYEQPAILRSYHVDLGIQYNAAWGPMRPYQPGTGGSMHGLGWGSVVHSMGVRLLDFGLAPAICQYGIGGTGSAWWLANEDIWLVWVQARLAELTRIRSMTVEVYQGEHEVFTVGEVGIWGPNWTQIIADVRSALALPTLPFVFVKQETFPAAISEQLTSLRAEQETLASTVSNVSLVRDTGVQGFIDDYHLDGASSVRIGKLAAEALVGIS